MYLEKRNLDPMDPGTKTLAFFLGMLIGYGMFGAVYALAQLVLNRGVFAGSGSMRRMREYSPRPLDDEYS
jgi:hypothetical protein